MTSLVVTKLPFSTNDSLRPKLRLDPLLDDLGDTVLFDYDLEAASYSGDLNPQNGARIRDLANANNGVVRLASDQIITRAGNGFAFDDVVAHNTYVEIPAAVSTALWAHQSFMIGLVVKLPTSGNWMPQTTGMLPFLSWSAGTTLNVGPELINIGMTNYTSVKRVNFFRKIGTITNVDLPATVNASDLGGVIYAFYWRNAAGVGYGYKSAVGTVYSTGARGDDNTQSFEGLVGKLGVGSTTWGSVLTGDAYGPCTMRVYRCWAANLHGSDIVPLDVINADYARVAARAVFS